MSNKEKCSELLNEYKEISGEKMQHAFNERNYGNREIGIQMVSELKDRLKEIEDEILKMVD